MKNFRSKELAAVKTRRILLDAVYHLSKSDTPATIGGCDAQQLLRRALASLDASLDASLQHFGDL